MVIAPIVMPMRPVVATVVALTSVKPKTLLFTRTGMTVPRTTRSKPSSSTAAQHSGTTQRELRTRVAPEWLPVIVSSLVPPPPALGLAVRFSPSVYPAPGTGR